MGIFSYAGSGIEDEINIVPYAQLLNPIKHTAIGFGIKKDQADLAGFKPDKNWELKKLMIGDGESEVYTCSKTRLLVLGRSELLMVKDSHIIKYDASQKEKGYDALSYLIVWFVNESNVPLSDLPFRVKTSSMAGKSLRDSLKIWQGQLLSAYKSLEGTTEGLSWSAGVFCVEWGKAQIESPDKKKINVSEVKSFSQITPQNLEQNFILPVSSTGKQLPIIKETIKDWCNLAQVSQEYKEILNPDIETLKLDCMSKLDQMGYTMLDKMKLLQDNFGITSINKMETSQLPKLNEFLDSLLSNQEQLVSLTESELELALF